MAGLLLAGCGPEDSKTTGDGGTGVPGGAVTPDAAPGKDTGPTGGAESADAAPGKDLEPLGGNLPPDAGPDDEYLPEPDPAIPRDPAQDGLSALREASGRPIEVLARGGHPRLILLDAPLPPAPDAVSGALLFLETNAKVWRLGDVREGLFLSRERLVDGGRLLVFGQRVNNEPIAGADLTMEIRDGRVTSVQGEWQTEPAAGVSGPLTATEAADRALAEAGQGATATGAARPAWVPTAAGDLVHAWQVQVSGPSGPVRYSVARVDGAIVGREALAQTDGPVRNAAVFNANNRTGEVCWFFNPQPKIWEDVRLPPFPAGDADALSTERALPGIIDWFRDVHGRDGWNNRGGANHAYIHFDVALRNAQWSGLCKIMEFGDGVASDDIVGHEFSHGVIEATAGLAYANQPGGLNESYADIFGTLFTDDERIGENGVFTFCGSLGRNQLRSMADPPACGDPDHVMASRSGDGLGLRPEVMFPDGPNDWGGVHTNSSLQNKAAWLLAKGGSHNGYAIPALGNLKTARLFYRTLTRRLGAHATFAESARLALDEAERMIAESADGFGPADRCPVRNAFASVGLLVGDADCDGRLDTAETDDDADGVADGVDLCPNAPNPGQADMDGDGLGDPCDAEADGDGLRNANDNCPLVPNPDQTDADADGRGDACDDADNDRILDVRDNCPMVYNPDQRNTDGDAQGDVCDDDDDNDRRPDLDDGCPLLPNAASNSDGDAFEDRCDNCEFEPNPDQADLDRDGQGDACDFDDDGDGLGDANDPCPLDADVGAGRLEVLTDFDGDGTPTACDADEQAWLNGASQAPFEAFVENLDRTPVRLPIGPCLQCPDYLPGDTTIQVQVEAPFGALARVVDDAGTVVGQANVGQEFQIGPLQSVYFDAAADVSYRAPGGSPEASVFRGRQYFLEIMPPELDPGVGFPLSVYVRSNLP